MDDMNKPDLTEELRKLAASPTSLAGKARSYFNLVSSRGLRKIKKTGPAKQGLGIGKKDGKGAK